MILASVTVGLVGCAVGLAIAYIATGILPPVEAALLAFLVGAWLRHWMVPLYRWVRRRA